MILFKRSLPVLAPLLLFLVLEFALAKNGLFFYLFPLALLIVVLPVGVLLHWRRSTAEFWHAVLLPLSLAAASIALLVFLSEAFFAHLLIVVTAVLLAWYLENLFLFHFQPERYQPYTLENGAAYMNFLVVFFSFSALLATRIFLNVPLIVLLLLGFGLAIYTTLQMLWSLKVSLGEGLVYALIQILIMVELFGAVVFLPTSFFVGGLCIAIPYYSMANLSRHALRDTLDARVVRRYATIGGIALLVALTTAPWT